MTDNFLVIKERVNLRVLMSDAGVEFDRSGRMAKCPFHDDHTPSLSIRDERFRCFACGQHGDVFDFIEKYYCMTKREALTFLGEEVGVDRMNPRIPPPRPHTRQRIETKRRRSEAKKQTGKGTPVTVESYPYRDAWGSSSI